MNKSINQKTILIFAHECAPYHLDISTIGAQRPAQFAKYLPSYNWCAIIICCDSQKRRVLDKRDLKSTEYIVNKYFNNTPQANSIIIPIPSLKYDGLIDRLWNWSSAKHSLFFNCLRKIFTFLKYFKGDYSQSWQPCARFAADLIAKKEKIDCCMAEHSPDAGLFLAKWFSEKYKVPWIVDFRDPVLHPLTKFTRIFYTPFLKKFLKSASLIINVNRYWSELDSKFFKKPAFSIPNGFDPEEYSSKIDLDANKIILGYFGNINKINILQEYSGLHILFSGISELLKENPDLTEKILFLFRGRGFIKVHNVAKEYDIDHCIDSAPAIKRNQALKLMQWSHALILFSVFPNSEDLFLKQGYYPGKVFEYFGARKPILCIPGDSGMLEALISETETGFVIKTKEDVVFFLKKFINNYIDDKYIDYKPNKIKVLQYTRKNQAKQLAEILNDISLINK